MSPTAIKRFVRTLSDPRSSEAQKAEAREQLRGVGARFSSTTERRILGETR